MKKTVFLIICVVFAFNATIFAQDVITKKDGTDIQAKVLEVNTTEIKYKKTDNQNGPIFTSLKSEILMVRYENGTKDIFNPSNLQTTIVNPDMCPMGQQDAEKNYSGENSGRGGVFLTTFLLSPLWGLIPAGICSASRPTDSHLKYPNAEFMKDDNYNKCYKENAYRIKRKKIWTSYAIGASFWVITIIALSSSN